MKPFIASEFISNQETPVVDKSGERVEIITTTARGEYSVLGYSGSGTLLLRWNSRGHYYAETPLNDDRNLFFAPKIEAVHVYQYKDDPKGRYVTVHSSKVKEYAGIMNSAVYTYLGTITGPIVPPEEGK